MRINMTRITMLGVLAGLCMQGMLRADDTPFSLPALDLSAASVAAATAQAPAAGPAAPFAQGSLTFQTYGSASLGDQAGDIYLGHAGVGYFVFDKISLNLEAVGGAVDSQDGSSDPSAVGLDLLIRYFFFQKGDLSVFAEGGAGIIWFDDHFPAAGTYQNFTPQVGLGLLYHLTGDLNLMLGARWHHVSNARKRGIEHNPGFDSGMVYMGIMIPF